MYIPDMQAPFVEDANLSNVYLYQDWGGFSYGLDSVSYIDLHVCVCASTMLFLLLWLCNITWK